MIVYAAGSGKLKATDTNGNTKDIGVVGEYQDTIKVSDVETSQYLYEVLKQLKIMNIHLSNMTDMDIEKADIED
jgi:hypothetical protein